MAGFHGVLETECPRAALEFGDNLSLFAVAAAAFSR
jgi:hypothetical protein